MIIAIHSDKEFNDGNISWSAIEIAERCIFCLFWWWVMGRTKQVYVVLYIYTYVCVYIHISIFIYLFIYLSVYLFVCLSTIIILIIIKMIIIAIIMITIYCLLSLLSYIYIYIYIYTCICALKQFMIKIKYQVRNYVSNKPYIVFQKTYCVPLFKLFWQRCP